MVNSAVDTLLEGQMILVAEIEKQFAESKSKKHAMKKAAEEATDTYDRLKVELEAEKAVLKYLEKIKREEDSFLQEKQRVSGGTEDGTAPSTQTETIRKAMSILRIGKAGGRKSETNLQARISIAAIAKAVQISIPDKVDPIPEVDLCKISDSSFNQVTSKASKIDLNRPCVCTCKKKI